MSAVRYFEGVPHIVRYGSHDEKEQKSWMLFWRCGVGFSLHVDHEDVRDTAFSKLWLPLLKEPTDEEGYKKWVEGWEALCDCKISQGLPLLKELAPESTHWVTLDDYIHTPTYELKIITDSSVKDAIAVITEGPNDTPAYETWPTAAANIKDLPVDAVHYHARDLIVLDKETNWRSSPAKVQGPDGRIFSFLACEKTSRYVDPPKDKMINWSLDAINAYSRLFNKIPGNIHIPQLEGIVVTDPSADIQDSSPGVDWKDDPRAKWESEQRQDTQMVAGILLTYIPRSETLEEVLKHEEDKPTTGQKEKWKRQIGQVIEFLHSQGTVLGGHTQQGSEDWYSINQYSVQIAGYGKGVDGEAWLPLSQSGVFDEGEGFDKGQAMDFLGLEKTFDFPCRVQPASPVIRESMLYVGTK